MLIELLAKHTHSNPPILHAQLKNLATTLILGMELAPESRMNDERAHIVDEGAIDLVQAHAAHCREAGHVLGDYAT